MGCNSRRKIMDPGESNRERVRCLPDTSSHLSSDFSTKNDWALSQPDASTGNESVARSWASKNLRNLFGKAANPLTPGSTPNGRNGKDLARMGSRKLSGDRESRCYVVAQGATKTAAD